MSTFITEVPTEPQIALLRDVAWERGLEAKVDPFLAKKPTPQEVSAAIDELKDPDNAARFPILPISDEQIAEIQALRAQLFEPGDDRPLPKDRAHANRQIRTFKRMMSGKRWGQAKAEAGQFFGAEGVLVTPVPQATTPLDVSEAPEPQTLSVAHAEAAEEPAPF